MKNVQQQTLGFEATIVKGDSGVADGAAELMVRQRVSKLAAKNLNVGNMGNLKW